MAVTKILAKSMRPDKLIKYVSNPKKTDEQIFVSCYGCELNSAATEMRETKKQFEKEDGIQMYHIIQSFSPGEISPEIAHELAREFAGRYLENYEVVIGTHVDKDHIHNHIAFNSVSYVDGLKYHSSPESYFKGIRKLSDELCKKYGLSIIIESPNIENQKTLSYAEWKMRKEGLMTLRDLFEKDLCECLTLSLDEGDFYALMESRGYTIRHHSKYPTFTPYGTNYNYRAKLANKSLSKADIVALIEKGLEAGLSDIGANEYGMSLFRERIPKEFMKNGKAKGFRALYFSWCYTLGLIGKGVYHPKGYASYTEVRKLERYKKHAEFLYDNKIDTRKDMAEKINELNAKMDKLVTERIKWNKKKRRRKKLYDALATVEFFSDVPEIYKAGNNLDGDEYEKYFAANALLRNVDQEELKREKQETYSKIASINEDVWKLRSEIRMCEKILKESGAVKDNMSEVDGELVYEEERGKENR